MNKNLVISLKTIFISLIVVLGIYVVYRLGPIIGILLVATLLVISLEPFVKKLMNFNLLNKPLSRSVSVIIAYLLVVTSLIIVVTVGVPPVFTQLQKMLLSLSQISKDLNLSGNFNFSLFDLLPQATNLSSEVLSLTLSLFSNLATLFTLLIISIYMSLDWENIKQRLLSFFPRNYEEEAFEVLNDVEVSISSWVKGQLILMVVVGVFSFIGLAILGVEYPLALAIISGFLEIVPMLGPIISAVIAAIIGFSEQPVLGFGVIALYVIIQQLENNILVPKIMQKVSGFSPLIILLALLVGSEFFGIVGAIIAVPTTMILTIVLKRVLNSNL